MASFLNRFNQKEMVWNSFKQTINRHITPYRWSSYNALTRPFKTFNNQNISQMTTNIIGLDYYDAPVWHGEVIIVQCVQSSVIITTYNHRPVQFLYCKHVTELRESYLSYWGPCRLSRVAHYLYQMMVSPLHYQMDQICLLQCTDFRDEILGTTDLRN